MNAIQLKTAIRMRKNNGGYVYMICRVSVNRQGMARATDWPPLNSRREWKIEETETAGVQ